MVPDCIIIAAIKVICSKVEVSTAPKMPRKYISPCLREFKEPNRDTIKKATEDFYIGMKVMSSEKYNIAVTKVI